MIGQSITKDCEFVIAIGCQPRVEIPIDSTCLGDVHDEHIWYRVVLIK